MRTDIYSYTNGNGKFLVELHTSGMHKRSLGNEFKEESILQVKNIIARLINNDSEFASNGFQRVVIDQNWKKVQIVDKNGNRVTHTISKLVNPLKETAVQPLEEVTPLLLASTDKAEGAQYMKGGFIERGFRPVTPMEKIWKFLSNISLFIRGAAAKQGKTLGSYDFAIHFFSKDASRKELQTCELRTSTMLNRLTDFFKENDIGTTDEFASIHRAAEWAKKIENLRDKKRSVIVSGFEKIARNIEHEVKKIESDQSLLIPFSSYEGENGQRVESLRLLRLTRNKDASDGSKLYKIEFIDDRENPPLDNVTEKSLNLEDFFKPLVDIQLSASYHEEPESFIDIFRKKDRVEINGGIEKKFINGFYHFAKNHPKIAAWFLMGKSQKEREPLVSLFTHAKSVGLLPIDVDPTKSNLKPEILIKDVFAPLLSADSLNEGSAMFCPKHSMLSTQRMIDNFLPLIKAEDQAKVEAKSLFHFYYLYEECLGEDPASMTILEDGVKRISELYDKLEIPDAQTNEMLFVIRKHLDQVKLKLLKREIDVDQKVKSPSLPDKFFTSIPGKVFNSNDKMGKLRGEKPLEYLPKLVADDSKRKMGEQETAKKEHLSRVGKLEEDVLQISAHAYLLDKIKIDFAKALAKSHEAAVQNLRNFIPSIRSTKLALPEAENLTARLEAIAAELNGLDPKEDKGLDLIQKYKDCLNELQEALRQKLPKVIQELIPAIKANKDNIQECLTKTIENLTTILEKDNNFNRSHYERNIAELKALFEASNDLDKMDDSHITDFINQVGRQPYARATRTQVKSIDTYLRKKDDLEAFGDTVRAHKNVISDFFAKKLEAKNSLILLLNEAKKTISNISRTNTESQNFSPNQMVVFGALVTNLTQKITVLQGKSTVEVLEDFSDFSASLTPFEKILRTAQTEWKQKIKSPDLTAHLKMIEERIQECQKKFSTPLDAKQIRLLRAEIELIIAQLPLENIEKIHSFWSEHLDWKQNIVDLQELLRIAYVSEKDDEHPDYLLHSSICNSIVHRMDWLELSKFNQKLLIIATKIQSCKQKIAPEMSSAEKEDLKKEIDAIMKELPPAESGSAKSFWSRQWRMDFNGGTATTEALITGLKEILRRVSPSKKGEYLRICEAVQKKMEDVYDPETELLTRQNELSDKYLRFDTPNRQRQFLAVVETIKTYKAREMQVATATTYQYKIGTKKPTSLSFAPATLPHLPVGEITPKPAVVQPEIKSGGLSARRFFDNPSCGLLDLFVGSEVDKTTDEIARTRSEESIRLDTHKYGKLTADKFYKLHATNSSDSHIGLEELLLLAASPEMLQLLNEKGSKLGVQLKRVILNRILRAGHIKEYLVDPNHSRAILKELTGCIEASSKKLPHAYTTLMSIKATLLIFLKEQEGKYEESQQQLQNIFKTLRQKIGPKDEAFNDAKLQLHTLRLKIYAATFSSDPKLTLSIENLSELIDSWCAYNSSATLDYSDKQEEETIRQFFYGHVLPAWDGLSIEDKNKALTIMLDARGELAPIDDHEERQSLIWNQDGEVYTAALTGEKGSPTCQIGVLSGSLSYNGVPVEVTGGSLPHDLWTQFPLFQENYSVVTAKKLDNTGQSIVYSFEVKELGHTRFQVEQLDGNIRYSVEVEDENGELHWYQHSSLAYPEKTIADNKAAQLERNRPRRLRIFTRLRDFIDRMKARSAQQKKTGFSKLKDKVKALGEALANQTLQPKKECSIPKDIMDNGVWIDKNKPNEAIVLDKQANRLVDVKLAHAKKRLQGGAEFNATLIKEVTKTVGEKEYLKTWRLVNNPKSSVYMQLCGLTKKENIKMWADAAGIVQEIELIDPKMVFERDPVSHKLMSKEVIGFYISDDQTIPVADFASDWQNYIILTNDVGERRLIMRQSSILSTYFLTQRGYERGLVIGEAKAVSDMAPPYIDVKIVEHPEKGYSLETKNPQGNFYLALAAMQAGNFENAVKYLRLASRSKYNKEQKDLLQALFAYKQHCFANPPAVSEEKDPFKLLSDLSTVMRQFDPLLPSIAAIKLAALAALLEQDLSKEESRLPADEKINMPAYDDVRKWIQAYHTADIPNYPWNPVSEGSKLTDDELHRIMVRYPKKPEDAGINAIRLDTAMAELVRPEVEKTTIERAGKIMGMERQPLETHDLKSQLVERLAQTRQSTSKEKVMTFYAGKYIVQHFQEMYEFIDRLDVSAKPGRIELKKIIKQLSRFKDADVGRSGAVKYLLSLAQMKLQGRIESNWIQIEAARKGLQNHILHLNHQRDSIVANFVSMIEVLENGKGGILDMMTPQESKQLQQLVERIKNVVIEGPDNDTLNQMTLEQIKAFTKSTLAIVNPMITELVTKIFSLANNQGVVVNSDTIPEFIPYKGYREKSLSTEEIIEINAWNIDRTLPAPRCLRKIKLHATYSLADHIRDPENDRFKLPGNKRIDEVLEDLGIFERMNKINEHKAGLEEAKRDNSAWGIARYTRLVNLTHKLNPVFERKQWEQSELREINKSLKGLQQHSGWMKKVQTPISFPKNEGDKYDEDRLSAFLVSHTELAHPPHKSGKEAPIVPAKDEEAKPRDWIGLLRSVMVQRPFDNADMALKAYQEKTGYFTEDSMPFFKKLSGEQLVEFDRTVRRAIANNSKSALDILHLIENKQFNGRPNAYELFNKFLKSIEPIVDPIDVPQECNRLRNEISKKTPSEDKKLIAEKGTIVFLEKGARVLKSPSLFTEGENIESMQKVQDSVIKATQEQEAVVKERRLQILNVVTKLPLNDKAKCAEELRRLRGSSAVIDIEMVFRFFAKDKLNELKKHNPSLTDADIQELVKLVTAHHIEATALHTSQKQLENGDKAIKLCKQFQELAGKNASIRDSVNRLNKMIPEFLRTAAAGNSIPESERTLAADNINRLIDELAKSKADADFPYPEAYTPQRLSDDIREYMALLEKSILYGTAERFYNPNYNHPHTRAALAYEFTLEKVFRSVQIKEFATRVGTPAIVSWLSTGAGKTFMAPGLAKMMATGTNLVTVIDTKDLIPTTSISRDENSRAVYGQAAYHFQFTRDPKRTVKSLQEMEYRLLKCINNEEYIVTTKEALASLVLQLLTWQRDGKDSIKHDDRIQVAQRIVSLFKERGVALGDEIHLILNIIEAIDYAEGDRKPLSEYKEYYETTSSIYRALYPPSNEMKKYILTSNDIAKRLKIADNQQAQVNKATIQEVMIDLADLLIKQSIDKDFITKDPLHKALGTLMTELRKISLGEDALIDYLTISEGSEKSDIALKVLATIKKMEAKEQMRLGSLKENLSSTFEMVMKKIADDDFGVMKRVTDYEGRELDDNLSICPYNKGRPQPSKDFSDIFQTIQTHYMGYLINGIPVEGLKEKIADWNTLIETELPQYNNDVMQCPAYIEYHSIFGESAPAIRDIDDRGIAELARSSKGKPEAIFKFLEKIVLPQRMVYPQKLGFNSMDLVSLFSKFGGYSGTIQTRPTFHSAVSNKDDPDVDAEAEANFKSVYDSPYNQAQYHIPDLDSDVFKKEGQGQRSYIPSFSAQLKAGNINIKEFRAVIDVGGLFKELNYVDMAKDILKQFTKEELEAVIIYNDDSEVRILRRGSDRMEPFDPSSKPPEYDKRFTVYRQPQFTGADIPQSLHAKALVTINEKTGWGDFEQGVGRLRENKKGQTFVTIYRDSLLAKVHDDIRIAQSKGNATVVEKLKKLIKTDKDNVTLDIKKLTKRAEKSDIKQRRYYSAISEMENIVKRQLIKQFCLPNWKNVFNIFEPFFFANSFKDIAQLLEIKMPMQPTKMLEIYKARLLERIDREIRLSPDAMTTIALEDAKTELRKYKFPKPEEMPEIVVGTSTDANSQVEVERETHKETENERELEVFTITQEEAASVASQNPEIDWKEWNLNSLASFISKTGKIPNTADGKPVAYRLANEGEALLSHLKTGKLKSNNKSLEIDYYTLFPDISVSVNMVQHRKKPLFVSDRYLIDYRLSGPIAKEHFPVSFLSHGQKCCQSIGEISVQNGNKRKYHHILLDVIDHKVFEASITRANAIMTPAFMDSVKAFAEAHPGITLAQAIRDFTMEFRSLFPNMEDAGFLVNLLGTNFLVSDVCTLSLRINMNGRVYTTACGALDIDYKDDELQEKIVRLKIITGETYFSKDEMKILKKIICEDYLKLIDFKEFEKELRDQKFTDDEIAEKIIEKRRLGISDFSELRVGAQPLHINRLIDLFRLYQKAVHMRVASEKPDVNSKHFGKMICKILKKFPTYKPVSFY